MELETKITELRVKQNAISGKISTKKQQIEKLTKQFTNIEKQIEDLESQELHSALKEQNATPMEAANLFKEFKKLNLSPLEAVELLKELNQGNSNSSSNIKESPVNYEGE
ncbi:hypothetical protein GFV15_05980 [Lactococcus lactis]|uniref:hypothetical protein n=1 Tax=Lactococcus lactis TaxID=1358 RepID=UPI00129338EA|nr:hypothetical protein [Lactococcus lactis]MQQ80502.1 hypothetical protein [Lactococcus lactis]